MTDLELTKLAAKAAGITLKITPYGKLLNCTGMHPIFPAPEWRPLEDDGDALRLAVKLRLCVDIGGRDIEVLWNDSDGKTFSVTEPELKSANCRRAIVRAAAKIGEGLE